MHRQLSINKNTIFTLSVNDLLCLRYHSQWNTLLDLIFGLILFCKQEDNTVICFYPKENSTFCISPGTLLPRNMMERIYCYF